MIGSKEQYERIMRNAEFQGKMPVEHVGLLAETIEALRRFLRASDAVEDGTVSFDLHHEQVEELRASRKALPDWLTDG